MTPKTISIHYRRLPDRVQIFDQVVLDESPECTVTLLESADLKRPATAAGREILQPGSPVVWFTFPGLWYDIGRFHLADGTFTGIYANVLTPVVMEDSRWETTDLCLDVWMDADGSVHILDEAEFQEAIDRGWIDDATAAVAHEHAETIAASARQGAWPPARVGEWTLDRALAHLDALSRE